VSVENGGVMTAEQMIAYEWAKKQEYQSVAARYAKMLAEAIDSMKAELTRLREAARCRPISELPPLEEHGLFSGPVLVKDKFGNMNIGCYAPNDGFVVIEYADSLGKIIGWWPLPTGPEEGKDDGT